LGVTTGAPGRIRAEIRPEHIRRLTQPGLFVTDRLDDIDAVHTCGAVPFSALTRSTDCIGSWDNVVVSEGHPQGSRKAIITTAM